MPLHLILILTAAIAFMLWMAFQDAGEDGLHEPQTETDDAACADRLDADAEAKPCQLAA